MEPIQAIEKPKANNNKYPITALVNPPLILQPIAKPVKDMMNKVITLRTKSAKFWPNKTPVVFIGNDLKRSIIPDVISAFKPMAADAPAKAIDINDLISETTRNVLKQKQGGDLIAAAKSHWIYARTRPEELDHRSYLSDAQARAYLNNYGDLRDAFGDDLLQAKRHWNFNGLNEGRSVSMGTSLLRIWRNEVQKKGYIEIVKTNPWHVRWSSDYIDLSKSSRIFLDDNGILYLYDKEKIVWQSYNEDAA